MPPHRMPRPDGSQVALMSSRNSGIPDDYFQHTLTAKLREKSNNPRIEVEGITARVRRRLQFATGALLRRTKRGRSRIVSIGHFRGHTGARADRCAIRPKPGCLFLSS
jgi:hypothetical protein